MEQLICASMGYALGSLIAESYWSDIDEGLTHVSTVFLGLDHRFYGQGPPILFETMIFGGWTFSDYQQRYSTWGQAESGHLAALKVVLDDFDERGLLIRE